MIAALDLTSVLLIVLIIPVLALLPLLLVVPLKKNGEVRFKGGRHSKVELLLANGADVNAITDSVWTPLHWASGEGHKDIVELLKEHGARE